LTYANVIQVSVVPEADCNIAVPGVRDLVEIDAYAARARTMSFALKARPMSFHKERRDKNCAGRLPRSKDRKPTIADLS
jgi:hypothetical protein